MLIISEFTSIEKQELKVAVVVEKTEFEVVEQELVVLRERLRHVAGYRLVWPGQY